MMLGDFRTVHTRQLWEQFVAGEDINHQSLPGHVYRAWKACRDNAIDPHKTLDMRCLPDDELSEMLKRYAELLDIAKPVLEMVLFSTSDTPFIVMLTSGEGVILHVTGNLESLSVQENFYNQPGVFCERGLFSARATTLCLEEKKAISLCGSEHYLEVFHNSLCYAAPVLDQSGKVLACVSLASSISNRNQKTLSMVCAAADTISSQLQRKQLYESKAYLSSMVYAICGVLPDGIIALDAQHRITYVNAAGEEILGSVFADVEGRAIVDFFDAASLQELTNLIDGNKRHSVSVALKGNAEGKWLCRVQPLSGANQAFTGMALFLASDKQIMQGLTQVGGNRAYYTLDDIKGASPQLKRCVQLAKRIAKKANRVLINGESGTGKELFAQGIHNAGPRRAQPFVAISCASIPRELIEAELFGYVSGSFTGANKNGAIGKFELAQNGTLFLDEIGSLPLEAQGKLLRALQQNEIVRIGGKVPIPVSVNVISANNVDLREMVKTKMFREDLLYRLNTVEITIPPLRERAGDTELLIKHFVESFARLQKRRMKISAGWMEAMVQHVWRGNVRELEHACEAAMILCDGDMLTRRHLPPSVSGAVDDELHSFAAAPCESMQENFQRWLLQAIEQCDGNLTTVAKRHGVSRSTLYRKVREYGIDVENFRARRRGEGALV
ncbi:sigma 54-interacting transcriptional regulator [Pseudomonas sp. DCB_AW]|uniref:sigma-54-dependent Fis family transcriptional regulator n=1 Tax=Pseudomonas sp. DCB_AW TaxID=2993596 RepID=UPI002248FEF7|nr:sigma 54-interacting transcriptional regulator [Pseudomonas sp. DCB_AW]MCX2684686.1 sigma 54-interacting transcriptional regulator [Pseudomonas sp. DCB_AW]